MRIAMQHESLYPEDHEIIGTVLAECRPLDGGSYTGDGDFEVHVTAFSPGNVLADLRCYQGPERRWLARRLATLCNDAGVWQRWLLANCQRVVDRYLEKNGGRQP